MPAVSFTVAELKILLSALPRETGSADFEVLRKRLERAAKRISVSSAKSKGRNLQQWVCREIADMTGLIYEAGDDESLIDSRQMGQQGLDIILRGLAQQRFPFSIECKSSETLSLHQAVEQVKANQRRDTDWLVIYKKKAFSEPVVILTWSAFRRLWSGSMGDVS